MAEGALTLHLDRGAYDSDVIKKACYEFLRYGIAVLIEPEVLQRYSVQITAHPTAVADGAAYAELRAKFIELLTDYSVRKIVEKETGQIRNLLYAQAFSSVELVTPEVSLLDGWTDPLKIAKRDGQSVGEGFSV